MSLSQNRMSAIIRYTDRLSQAFVLGFYARHQTQLVDPAQRELVIVVLSFAIAASAYLESQLNRLDQNNYLLLKQFFERLFSLIGIAISWSWVSVVTDYYSEMLSPYLSAESIYRTLGLLVALSFFSTIQTYLDDRLVHHQ